MITYIKNIHYFNNPIVDSLELAIQQIKTGVFKPQIERLREIKDKDEYRQLKKEILPCYAFNGVFSKSVTNANFTESSGLFHYDIDGIDYKEAVETKQFLSDMPETLFCFVSPSGLGLKGAFRIMDDLIHNDADFKLAFEQIDRLMRGHGIKIDTSCKDVRRLCFASYDPEIYYNPDSTPLPLPPLAKKANGSTYVKNNDNNHHLEIIRKIMMAGVVGVNMHTTRLSAARTAGGYIANGMLKEDEAIKLLFEISDSMAGEGITSRSERKTIFDGLEMGKQQPFPLKKDQENKEVKEAQEWNDNLSGGIDYIIPFDGTARDIQQWILSTSIYPQPAIAYAATMLTIATAIGRNIAYENIKGNLMFVCTAESGEGKDHPYKCSQRILDAIDLSTSKCFKLASGAVFLSRLSATPSMLLYLDEFGNYLESINGKKSNAYANEIIGYMTELYTSASGSFTGKDAITNPATTIIEPNLSVFGLTTERQIFDNLKTSDLANGSLARFSVLFGSKGLEPKRIKNYELDVPEKIISGLKKLINDNKAPIFEPFKSRQLQRTVEYDNEKFELMMRLKKKSNSMINSDGDKENFAAMYNRVAVRCIQQAIVLDQCQSVDVLKWVEKLELDSVSVFAKKFMLLGSDNENERQSKVLLAVIKKASKKGIAKGDLTRKTLQLTTQTRNSLLKELEDSKLIFTEATPRGVKYFWAK